MTTAALAAMTTADLDALLDGIVEGTVTVADPARVYDDALTERFAPHRSTATLPLTESPAPAAVTAYLF